MLPWSETPDREPPRGDVPPVPALVTGGAWGGPGTADSEGQVPNAAIDWEPLRLV